MSSADAALLLCIPNPAWRGGTHKKNNFFTLLVRTGKVTSTARGSILFLLPCHLHACLDVHFGKWEHVVAFVHKSTMVLLTVVGVLFPLIPST